MTHAPDEEQQRQEAIRQSQPVDAINFEGEDGTNCYVRAEIVTGLLFWIAQGNFSAMTVPAIEALNKTVERAKQAVA